MMFLRRQLPLLITMITGLVMAAQYYVPHPASEQLLTTVTKWLQIIGGFALVPVSSRIERGERGDVGVAGRRVHIDLERMVVFERVEVVDGAEAFFRHVDGGDVTEEIEGQFPALLQSADEFEEVIRGDVEDHIGGVLAGRERDLPQVLVHEGGDAGIGGGGFVAHPTIRFSSMIFSWRRRRPSRSDSGRGGQPGT